MKSPIPPDAERISLAEETAWLWQTQSGWCVFQWPYQVYVANIQRKGEDWHTIDWRNESPRQGDFEGGLARNERGHLDRAQLLEIAENLIRALRRQNASPAPPQKQQGPAEAGP